MTLTEKIFAKKAGKYEARAGEIVTVELTWVMSHDNSEAILLKFKETGVERARESASIML